MNSGAVHSIRTPGANLHKDTSGVRTLCNRRGRIVQSSAPIPTRKKDGSGRAAGPCARAGVRGAGQPDGNDRIAKIERVLRELLVLAIAALLVLAVAYIAFWLKARGLDADMDAVNVSRGAG